MKKKRKKGREKGKGKGKEKGKEEEKKEEMEGIGGRGQGNGCEREGKGIKKG